MFSASLRDESSGQRKRRSFYGLTPEEAEAKARAAMGAVLVDANGAKTSPEFTRAAAKAAATHTRREWFAKVRAAGNLCHYCGRDTRRTGLEQDHCTPISRGGTNALENVVPCCPACNAEKSNMTLEEYVVWRFKNWGYVGSVPRG